MAKEPFGTWKSPITAQNITQDSVKLTDVLVDAIANIIYHVESRPSEGGRGVLVESATGRDIIGREWNVRTGVMEYGGSPAMVHDGVAYFSNFSDGGLYLVDVKEGSEPRRGTPESKVHRYANLDAHPKHPHLLVSVLEDHTDATSPTSVVNTLCVINTSTSTVSPLISGADFYASPKFSPDGTHIVWQQWYLPDMPWQGAEIMVADIVIEESGTVVVQNSTHIAGQKTTNSATYPGWATNTTVVFTSDISGYQNPWKYDLERREATPVFSKAVEEDFGEPGWGLGRSPYAVLDAEGWTLFAAFKDGRHVLYAVNIVDGRRMFLDNPYVEILNMRSCGTEKVVFIGEKVDTEPQLPICTVSTANPNFTAVFSLATHPSASLPFSPSFFSVAQPMTLKAGPDGRSIHILYYPPTNPEYVGSSVDGERPPCVVYAHGGPTHYSGHGLNMMTQYYTSRGWAWLSVNYGGSWGYGRKYVERLAGQWGVVDVEDSIQAAKIISNEPYNLVDPKRIVIRGTSSGGLTVLGAVSMGSDLTTFAAATSCYGISDLRKLAEDTHKFESGYGDGLLGGSSAEVPQVYKDRSPVTHADSIVSPLLILQGDIDRVVPKEQAEAIFGSIQRRGGVVDYHLYAGEGHGWRQEKNMIDALERELRFYETTLKLK